MQSRGVAAPICCSVCVFFVLRWVEMETPHSCAALLRQTTYMNVVAMDGACGGFVSLLCCVALRPPDKHRVLRKQPAVQKRGVQH